MIEKFLNENRQALSRIHEVLGRKNGFIKDSEK